MKSADIRSAFLKYFELHGHKIVPSSTLVPVNDSTLLFTNAGMVQFKDVFLGREQRDYVRATSSQRCVRAGGKHNDLENVGYTARHHTFFEMLGNFSFGDYFKREAIQFAWEFLTVELGLPKEKLWVTVYKDDQQAEDIWLKEIGVSAERFSRLGEKDNFWAMGDTGPCGPCSEIFYDHGEAVAGGPPGSPEEDGDRYIEIWNLVFMQYDRQPDGQLIPLPKPSVDTGMGLERIAAVMQGVHSNYEIDLFQNLIAAVKKVTGTKDLKSKSLQVVADHIRSCAFLISDGVIPSNEGRGYVLRRIIRRAIRHGHKLGVEQAFFHKLVPALVKEMGAAYPELVSAKDQIATVLLAEEEQFAKTLDQGLKILDQDLATLKGKVIAGETVFRLYDTYGFPLDLTADIARERGMSVDHAGFEVAMEAQRSRARAANQFGSEQLVKLDADDKTDFTGYDHQQGQAQVQALFVDSKKVDAVNAGQQAIVLLDQTPFYAESGGQVGDTGFMQWAAGSFQVDNTQKEGAAVLHIGSVQSGTLFIGQTVAVEINSRKRKATALNHSATHLMHAALRQVLGDHVSQKGSLVDAEKLRFDFSHFEAVTQAQLDDIERLVNAQIRHNSAVNTRLMDLEAAKNSGAVALFGEKYDQQVRVLSMGENNFSVELCGGTHVNRTGDIGVFKITSESGVAAGVRRIEALTGENAYEWLKFGEHALKQATQMLKTSREQFTDKLQQSLLQSRQLEKEIDQLKVKLASHAGSDLSSQAVDVQGIKVLVQHLDGVDPKSLRSTMDQLKNKLGSAVILLATTKDEKVSLVAGVTSDLTGRFKAGELVNHVALQVGGKGGGRADMAQAGGSEPSKLPQALASVSAWVVEKA
ncbi:MAG TPA: alanine--tRNA ligase [Pseudomonadales bacterium]